MLNRNWDIGFFIVAAKRLYAIFSVGFILYLSYCLTLRKPEKVCVQTIILDAQGRVQMINCDPFSTLQKPVVEKIVADVIEGIFTYRKGDQHSYAKRHVNDIKYISTTGTAASFFNKEFSKIVGADLKGPINAENSTFKIDTASIEYLTPKDIASMKIWRLKFTGTRCLEQSQGPISQKYSISASLIEGDYNAIYKVHDISYSIIDNQGSC